jgi:hypothetical protein
MKAGKMTMMTCNEQTNNDKVRTTLTTYKRKKTSSSERQQPQLALRNLELSLGLRGVVNHGPITVEFKKSRVKVTDVLVHFGLQHFVAFVVTKHTQTQTSCLHLS